MLRVQVKSEMTAFEGGVTDGKRKRNNDMRFKSLVSCITVFHFLAIDKGLCISIVGNLLLFSIKLLAGVKQNCNTALLQV